MLASFVWILKGKITFVYLAMLRIRFDSIYFVYKPSLIAYVSQLDFFVDDVIHLYGRYIFQCNTHQMVNFEFD